LLLRLHLIDIALTQLAAKTDLDGFTVLHSLHKRVNTDDRADSEAPQQVTESTQSSATLVSIKQPIIARMLRMSVVLAHSLLAKKHTAGVWVRPNEEVKWSPSLFSRRKIKCSEARFSQPTAGDRIDQT
jgi:hypothetical protein